LRSVSSADGRVAEEDIRWVQAEAKSKRLPSNELYLHHFFQGFEIDRSPCEHPFGKEGKLLSAHYRSLAGDAGTIKDSLYLANQMGCRVEELIFSGLASAAVVTTVPERENGVCVVDIGSEITDYVVYKKSKVIFAGTIPIGGRHFTNDLCSALYLHFEDGEALKRRVGIPEGDPTYLEEKIWVVGNASIGDKKVRHRALRIVLRARGTELFEELQDALGSMNEPVLTVLTGGGAQLKNLEHVAGTVLRTSVCCRNPRSKENEETVHPFCWSTGLGLLYYASRPTTESPSPRSTLWNHIGGWLRKHF
jgi:cell division protein FtsA